MNEIEPFTALLFGLGPIEHWITPNMEDGFNSSKLYVLFETNYYESSALQKEKDAMKKIKYHNHKR